MGAGEGPLLKILRMFSQMGLKCQSSVGKGKGNAHGSFPVWFRANAQEKLKLKQRTTVVTYPSLEKKKKWEKAFLKDGCGF